MYEGSFSVENDLGIGGTAGAFGADSDGGSVLEAPKMPLRRLDFLVRTRVLCVAWLSVVSLALDLSGMLSAAEIDLRLLASIFKEFLRDSSPFVGLAVSLVGEDDLDCDDIQLFLRNLVRDRAGETEAGESDCLMFSLRLDFGSSEGSRLLLEKGLNFDDRRETLGLSCGICAWGPSSESGLEPSDDVEDVPSAPMPLFNSSSDIVPFNSST